MAPVNGTGTKSEARYASLTEESATTASGLGAAAGFDIRLADGSDPGAAIRRITAAVTPARIQLARPQLEDIFISLVSDGGAPAPALLASLQDVDAGATA